MPVAHARVADSLRRGISAARFLHTSWRDTGGWGLKIPEGSGRLVEQGNQNLQRDICPDTF